MGKQTMKPGLVNIMVVMILLFFWQAGQASQHEQEKTPRTTIRDSVQENFPETFARAMNAYGLHRFTSGQTPGTRGQHPVILVHGLDEPGDIWLDLAPALTNGGFDVWILRYPNDQSIHKSALLVSSQLQKFASEHGLYDVSFVCHSMGGLVMRDVMTSPEIAYRDLVTRGKIPVARHLIMVGTPNHGSYFAKLRFLLEIRDLLTSVVDGNYQWLQTVIDGTGEAGADLLPDSKFLRDLNARPLPEAGRMLVVAGIMTPVELEQMIGFISEIKRSLPPAADSLVDTITSFTDSLVSDIGDGVVSLESAALEGVPLIQVRGNHLSILRNFGLVSSSVPTAIPVILQELTKTSL